jgi:hypothetical protein
VVRAAVEVVQLVVDVKVVVTVVLYLTTVKVVNVIEPVEMRNRSGLEGSTAVVA